MKKKTEDVCDMLRGVPPGRILLAFGDKPAKTLEQHIQDRSKKKPKTGGKKP